MGNDRSGGSLCCDAVCGRLSSTPVRINLLTLGHSPPYYAASARVSALLGPVGTPWLFCGVFSRDRERVTRCIRYIQPAALYLASALRQRRDARRPRPPREQRRNPQASENRESPKAEFARGRALAAGGGAALSEDQRIVCST